MVEFIRHLFGACGEGHPSILWFLGPGALVWYYIKHNIQWCWRKGCEMCKKKLEKYEKINK